MTDIVQRLRKATVYEHGEATYSNLGDEAAEEIERLRAVDRSGSGDMAPPKVFGPGKITVAEICKLLSEWPSGTYYAIHEKVYAALPSLLSAVEACEKELTRGAGAADEIERLRDVLGKTERDLERALAALDHHLKADR